MTAQPKPDTEGGHIMTLEEMRRHEWIVTWSGGKDSTATILLMHENAIPIKRIIYVKMMFDDETPATLPIMNNFIEIGAAKFREWGYNVEIIPSIQTALEVAETKYKRSKNKAWNGHAWGITPFMRGACRFAGVKRDTVWKNIDKDHDYQMIGYAADEYKRIHRLSGTRQSIMVTLGTTTPQAFEICRRYDLLSPLYGTGIARDGCFFCPNANKLQRAKLRSEHPELIEKINQIIKLSDYDISCVKNLNNWLKDYFDELDEAADPQKQTKITDF